MKNLAKTKYVIGVAKEFKSYISDYVTKLNTLFLVTSVIASCH